MPEVWEQEGHVRAGAFLRGDFQEELKSYAAVWGDDSPDVGAEGSPGPFITFYAVAGHNFPVPPPPTPHQFRLSADSIDTAGLTKALRTAHKGNGANRPVCRRRHRRQR